MKPTERLDPASREEVLDILMDAAHRENAGVLFSTHITSDLDKCAVRRHPRIARRETRGVGAARRLRGALRRWPRCPRRAAADAPVLGLRRRTAAGDSALVPSDAGIGHPATLEDIMTHLPKRGCRMKALSVMKEFRLVVHPATYMLALLGVLVLIPSWMYGAIFIYGILVAFFNGMNAREYWHDLAYSFALPASRRAMVRARAGGHGPHRSLHAGVHRPARTISASTVSPSSRGLVGCAANPLPRRARLCALRPVQRRVLPAVLSKPPGSGRALRPPPAFRLRLPSPCWRHSPICPGSSARP